MYELSESSYSFDYVRENGRLFTKEDVIIWADDVAEMIFNDNPEEKRVVVGNDIEVALNTLNAANEFLTKIKQVKEGESNNENN